MDKVFMTDLFKKIVKIQTVIIDGPVFRLHYKLTSLTLLVCSLLVTGYQFFGDPIMCIQRDDVPEKLLNTYCWIEGTFTLPHALNKTVGVEVAYPGVDKYTEGDKVVVHAYYQWVCFVIFLQACMFFVPRMMWRLWEGGRLKKLLQKLNNPALTTSDQHKNCRQFRRYMKGTVKYHSKYASLYFVCVVMNFVNVVGQIFFIDKFLGGEFTTYGSEVVSFVNTDQEDRVDPMVRVFPRITKCTFHKFGSSGNVQRHDALCLLPLNIVNEKIFVFMWFWFVILAVLSGLAIAYHIALYFFPHFRCYMMRTVSRLTPNDEVDDLCSRVNYGDWFLLYMLGSNCDAIHFRCLTQDLLHKFAFRRVPAGEEDVDSEEDEEAEKKEKKRRARYEEVLAIEREEHLLCPCPQDSNDHSPAESDSPKVPPPNESSA